MHVIAPTARISKLAELEDSVRGSKLIIEDGVFIDAFVKIKFTGGSGDIRIGKNSYINSGTVIYSGNGVTIGEFVQIAANCTLAPVNHAFQSKDKLIREQGFLPSRGGLVIEDDVWIGANCVLLDGAIVRRGAVIGALSLVNKEVAAYSINHGTPCQPVGQRT